MKYVKMDQLFIMLQAAEAGAKAAQEASKMLTKGFGKAIGSFF